MMSGCATMQAGAPKGAIDVIAHRGARAYAPENTLAAFRLAREMGADWFELDCHRTRDGHVVVIHDHTVDRTTNGKGDLREMTLDELKALDAGSWMDARFSGEPLPTLAEALELADRHFGVYVEIKSASDDKALEREILSAMDGVSKASPEQLRRIMTMIEASETPNLALTRATIDLLRQREARRFAVVQSFSPIVCAIMLAEAPEFRTEFLGADDKKKPEMWGTYLRWGHLLDVAGFNVHYQSLTPERLSEFHRAGKTVSVWTVNEEEDMRRMAEWRVDGIITDKPDVCLRVLGRTQPR